MACFESCRATLSAARAIVGASPHGACSLLDCSEACSLLSEGGADSRCLSLVAAGSCARVGRFRCVELGRRLPGLVRHTPAVAPVSLLPIAFWIKSAAKSQSAEWRCLEPVCHRLATYKRRLVQSLQPGDGALPASPERARRLTHSTPETDRRSTRFGFWAVASWSGSLRCVLASWRAYGMRHYQICYS